MSVRVLEELFEAGRNVTDCVIATCVCLTLSKCDSNACDAVQMCVTLPQIKLTCV